LASGLWLLSRPRDGWRCGVFLQLVLLCWRMDYFAFLRGIVAEFTIPALTLPNRERDSWSHSSASWSKKKKSAACAPPSVQYLSPEVVRRFAAQIRTASNPPHETEIHRNVQRHSTASTTIPKKLDASGNWPFFPQSIPFRHDSYRLRTPRHPRQIHRRRRDGFLERLL